MAELDHRQNRKDFQQPIANLRCFERGQQAEPSLEQAGN